jgi:hypothetical protein
MGQKMLNYVVLNLLFTFYLKKLKQYKVSKKANSKMD